MNPEKDDLSVKDFAASFKGFLDQMSLQPCVSDEPYFVRRIRAHFDEDPSRLSILTQDFKKYDHANVHLALEDFLSQKGRSYEILGFTSQLAGLKAPSLNELISSGSAGLFGGMSSPKEGPVQYVNLPIDGDRNIACVQTGLYLVSDNDKRLIVLLTSADGVMREKLQLEVMTKERSVAEHFLNELRNLLKQRNIYRGQILSVDGDGILGGVTIKFHTLPGVTRDAIILPEGLLARIERQAIAFSKNSEAMLKARRHLKRGLLLYGPPGTGKTLTAMYLANEMHDRTVLLLTGRSLNLIEQTCALARTLQPSMVVLEDVDLVAEERTRQSGCPTPVLFELLNEMDGLASDSDIIFLLTTNRPDILEPALAARPGRIDQAFEIALPDETSRKRLFELYAQGLEFDVKNIDQFIKRTKGASAAFIRELMRKAALFATDGSETITVKDRHLDEALHELVIEGGPLTKSLLGFRDN